MSVTLALHHSGLWLLLLKFGFGAACTGISLGRELEMHILELNPRPTKLDSRGLPADSQEDRRWFNRSPSTHRDLESGLPRTFPDPPTPSFSLAVLCPI